jgi:hypothetical protein
MQDAYQPDPRLRKEYCPLSTNHDFRCTEDQPKPQLWGNVRSAQCKQDVYDALVLFSQRNAAFSNIPDDVKLKLEEYGF